MIYHYTRVMKEIFNRPFDEVLFFYFCSSEIKPNIASRLFNFFALREEWKNEKEGGRETFCWMREKNCAYIYVGILRKMPENNEKNSPPSNYPSFLFPSFQFEWKPCLKLKTKMENHSNIKSFCAISMPVSLFWAKNLITGWKIFSSLVFYDC